MEDQQKSNRKRKIVETEESASQESNREPQVEERVQYRVQRKIAKVIYQSNDPKLVKKAICLQLG